MFFQKIVESTTRIFRPIVRAQNFDFTFQGVFSQSLENFETVCHFGTAAQQKNGNETTEVICECHEVQEI